MPASPWDSGPWQEDRDRDRNKKQEPAPLENERERERGATQRNVRYDQGDTSGRCPDTHADLVGNGASLPGDTGQVLSSDSSSHLWCHVVRMGCWQ